ncbi:MAG: hypothetical protein K8J08_13050 [Thermoanaerobaculia bacterium]|nr:hypothetical protein [Thermoanaerobaculia bacterium]
MNDDGNTTLAFEPESRSDLFSQPSDQLLIVDRAGLLGMVPALPCLFFGLPSLAIVVGSVVKGQLLSNWILVLLCTLLGVPLTYLGLGFLTFARCTRFDRTTRSGEQWFRLIHRWQRNEFQLRDKSRITLDRESAHKNPRRYRAMLTTRGETLKISEGLRKRRVAEHCRQISEFLGIPVVDRTVD